MNKWLPQVLGFAVAAVLSAPTPAHCHLENVAELHVASVGNVLLTSGVIDEHDARFLIDTGSNMSMIWRPAAERLGLRVVTGPKVKLYGLGGELIVSSAIVTELRVAQFEETERRFPVAGDLPTGVDFVLGEDLLSRYSVEFDLRNQVVRTMQPIECTVEQLPYWAKTYSIADLIASPRDARAIRVNVQLNGKTVAAQIDSGASVSLLSTAMAEAIGLHPTTPAGEASGFGRGTPETSTAEVASFTFGDETIQNTRLLVAQMDKFRTVVRMGSRLPETAAAAPDLLLGLDFLRAHHLIIDNVTRKIVFTYNGGPIFEAALPQ